MSLENWFNKTERNEFQRNKLLYLRLPIGYPDEDSVPYAEWHNTYRPLNEMVEEL